MTLPCSSDQNRVKDLLPSEIYDRKKMGFQLPMDDWMRGPLETFTSEGLAHVTEQGFLSSEQVRDLLEQFASGKLYWQKLWAVVVLGWYLQRSGFQTSQKVRNELQG